MALVLDETFAAGIPGSFATARAQAGTLTATYNSTAQAVDLANTTAGQNIWDITSQPLRTSGEFEIDLEFLSDQSGANNFRAGGLWGVGGQTAVSNGFRMSHTASTWAMDGWGGGTSWSGVNAQITSSQGTDDVFNTAGDRRVLNLRWDMTGGVSKVSVEGRIDGVLRFSVANLYLPSLRPGVWCYQSTVRLHSIKVWDAPQAALPAIGGSRQFGDTLHTNNSPPDAANPARAISRGILPTATSMAYTGSGRIRGTVKERNSPANTPLSRRVVLLAEQGLIPLRQVWSDPLTGAYSFDYLNRSERYTVLAYDYTGTYRGVIADGQIPEAMQ